MNNDKRHKLKAELDKMFPKTEVDDLRAKLIKEVKEKDRAILVEAVLKKINPIFKKLDIAEPIIEIKIPEMNIGDVAPKIEVITLNASEIPRPIVNVPPAIITVKSPDVKVPKANIIVKPPEVKVKVAAPDIKIPAFPTEMTVKGFKEFTKALTEWYKKMHEDNRMDYDNKNPMPVILQDKYGDPFKFVIPPIKVDGGGGGISVISMKDKEPTGYQKLTVDDTVGGVGLTVPDGSNYAVMVCENAHIRWRDDNINPTATVGMPLYSRQSLALDGALLLAQFKAIRQATTSGVLHISYYKK